MRIVVTSVLVDDQEKALQFYTDVLGFVKKNDIPMGEARWLTVVSPQDPDGTELLLEPDGHPAAGPFKEALVADGIPYTSFGVDDVKAEFNRLKGLGEMDFEELGVTTMDANLRTLLQVNVEQAAIADEVFSILMGDDVELRKHFIQTNAKDVRFLDI